MPNIEVYLPPNVVGLPTYACHEADSLWVGFILDTYRNQMHLTGREVQIDHQLGYARVNVISKATADETYGFGTKLVTRDEFTGCIVTPDDILLRPLFAKPLHRSFEILDLKREMRNKINRTQEYWFVDAMIYLLNEVSLGRFDEESYRRNVLEFQKYYESVMN